MSGDKTASEAHSAAAVEQQAAAAAAEQQQQPAEHPATAGAAVDEDDENETCGFCRFMKGGGCRTAFIEWSKCVDSEREAGSDFTEECREKTLALRECMLKHADYYRPMLEEEEEALREEEAAQAAAAAEQQQAGGEAAGSSGGSAAGGGDGAEGVGAAAPK